MNQPILHSTLLCAALSAGLEAQTTGWAWTQVANSGPAARDRHAMAFDSARGLTLLFGNDGTNTTWAWDGVSWTQVTNAGPGSRTGPVMAFDNARSRTVLFGGATYTDTWEWDGTSWTQTATGGTNLPSEYMALVYDPVRARAVMFGGSTGSGGGLKRDTWEWSGSSWNPVASSGPSARYGHAMAYDRARARIVLFGGATSAAGNFSGETWEWDGTQWTQVTATGTAPSARYLHAMTYDNVHGCSVLFGGYAGSNFNDTWIWDGTTWSPLAALGPSGRVQHALAYQANRASSVLFGGSSNGGLLGDTWELTGPPVGPTQPVTCTPQTQSNPPAPLANHSLAPLPNGGHLLFGGSSISSTQTLTNGTWTTQFPTLNPAPRSSASLMLDVARGNNVMFGGVNPLGVPLSDTWTYANGQWALAAPATSPSARSEHRMAYDTTRQRGVLFGGKNATGSPLGDQWHWNGTTWTSVTPTTLPSARYGHGLAYDKARDRMVMHGGQDASGLRDDLWESNGTTWTLIPPIIHNGFAWKPPARARHGFAYDPAAERVVLLGGVTATAGCQGDTWSWDGTDWLLHSPQGAAPSARSAAQLVEGGAPTDRLLWFAGGCGGTNTNDLWRIEIPVIARVLPYGAGCPPRSGPAPTLSEIPGTLPRLGSAFGIRVGNLPSVLTIAIPFLGLSKATWNGLPLPLDLATYGLPGCSLYAQAAVNTVLLGAVTADWPLAIPNNPTFAGLNLFYQAFVTMPNAGNAGGGVMTNALRVVIGA